MGKRNHERENDAIGISGGDTHYKCVCWGRGEGYEGGGRGIGAAVNPRQEIGGAGGDGGGRLKERRGILITCVCVLGRKGGSVDGWFFKR